MSSLTVGGTAFRCRPWPKPKVIPAIEWVQDSAGAWIGSDRGAAQDIYEAEVTFADSNVNIIGLEIVLNANREGITLSTMNTEIFAPNVNHTGSIACSVVDFGVRENVQFSGTTSSVQTLTVTFRALSPTLLGTTPSLATLRLQEAYSGDHSWEVGKAFAYSQAGAYSDHKSDTGYFKGAFQQTRTEAQAILAYLLITARATAVTLPTFPGVEYPFGYTRGPGPFLASIPKFEISRKDLNRWILGIEWAEAP